MPEITIDLIRRRAEHNEGLIHSLEELSLHQVSRHPIFRFWLWEIGCLLGI